MTSDVAITAPSPPSSSAKKGPGRPRIITAESPEQRIERLQGELHHAQEAKKIADQHRAEIVGAVVLRHASTDEGFRQQLATVLRKAVTLRAEFKSKPILAAIREVLDELDSIPSPTPSASPSS